MTSHRISRVLQRLMLVLFCCTVFLVSQLAWSLRARSLAFLLALAGLLGLIVLMYQSRAGAAETQRA